MRITQPLSWSPDSSRIVLVAGHGAGFDEKLE